MVTVREFARQVGKSHVMILNLVREGVLPRNADGTIPLAEGLRAYKAYELKPKNRGGRPKKGENPKPKEKVAVYQDRKIEKKKAYRKEAGNNRTGRRLSRSRS